MMGFGSDKVAGARLAWVRGADWCPEWMRGLQRQLHRHVFRSVLPLALALPVVFMPFTVNAEPLRVVASFSILADMVRNVGGPHVQVSSLVAPQTDAHGFEPRPQDVKTLAQASVLVVNGLGFETWLPGLQQASGFKGLTVVASQGSSLIEVGGASPTVADTPDPAHHGHAKHGAHDQHDHADHRGHDHGPIDPHAWQDLGNGVHYVQAIAQALAQADPTNADAYRRRAGDYAAQLQKLDSDIKSRLAAVPEQNRKVISSHDAFAYFARAYGVQFIPVAGISGRAEASARGVAQLIDRVRGEKIAGIFVESGANSRMVEQLARETGAKVGGELYSDALATPGSPADTYLGMMRWNADQLLGVLSP